MMVEPVAMTDEEKRVAEALAGLTGAGVTPERARAIAREEIASLAGLVLRRLQEPHSTRSFERNAADDAVRERMSAIFGEALSDFSEHTGGDAPGGTE